MGIRAKLFLTQLFVITLALAGADAFLIKRLRRALLDRLAADLTHQAELAVRDLELFPGVSPQRLAHELGAASGARFTFIEPGGQVVGDTDLTLAQLAQLENHARRPEIQAARAQGRGEALRFSTTIKADLLYVALARGAAGSPQGFVRAALPATQVDALVGEVRGLVAFGSLLALLLAALLSASVLGALTGSARALAQTAEAMAAGDLRARSPPLGGDELGTLGRALDRLGDQLAAQLGLLRGERDRLGAILEAMVEGVLVLDREQRVLLANRSVKEILSLPAELGETLLDLQRIPALHALAERALRGEPQTEEIPLSDDRATLVHTAPLREEGAVLVFHDVTDLKRLEAVRRDFVANVSHELRTPLTAIRGYAETLLGGALGEPARAAEFTAIIHRHAERLARLLDDLLELSRLEAGRRTLASDPVVIRFAAESALDLVRPKASERGLELHVELADGLEARGDPGALIQILLNLLDNAVKFTPPGGRVSLRSERAGERVRLSIVDTGLGMEERHQLRIFERFYRVDAGRSREMGGTGLGLAIVKHLVQAMGGEVGVESAPGKGSTFWLELPAA